MAKKTSATKKKVFEVKRGPVKPMEYECGGVISRVVFSFEDPEIAIEDDLPLGIQQAKACLAILEAFVEDYS